MLLLLATLVGWAASYDPDLTWRTLETPNFNITFHGGEEQLAEEVSLVLEEVVWPKMTGEIGHFPRRSIEVVIVDNTDSANGYAMTVPLNTIVIFATAPTGRSTLSLYEDWADALLTHELTHILHIDDTDGIVKAVRAVLGRIISTNNVSPGWIVEGFATYQETRHTNAGRGRAPMADMVKRMAVLEDKFPPLGNMDGWQTDPPAGNLRYLFGQDFIGFIAERSGDDAWHNWIHTYGGWIPYWLPTKRVFGQSFRQYYQQWKSTREQQYQQVRQQLEAQGLTAFTLLTSDNEGCASPSFSPDGTKVVWSCSNPRRGSAVYLMDLDEGQSVTEGQAELEIENFYASHVAWRADSKAFAYSTSHVVGRFNQYADTYLYKLGSNGGSKRALTSGKRARDPAFSPDGRELLVVRNATQQNQLARMTVDQRLVDLTDNQDHTQISTPRFNPSGEFLAMSMWKDGRRDLWITDPNGVPVRRLTFDTALDVHPHWSQDGRLLYFSSDRSGIFNIYAIDLTNEHLYQVTNVLGGAFQPSVNPTGTELIFESYSHNGSDIAMIPVQKDEWWDLGPLPNPVDSSKPLAAVIPTPQALEVIRAGLEAEGAFEREPRNEPDAKVDKTRKKKTKLVPTSLIDPVQTKGFEGWGGTFGVNEHLGGHVPGLDAPDTGPLSDDPTLTEGETLAEEEFDFTYPSGRYRPIPSLLPPRYVMPSIYQTSYGFMGNISSGGTDTLRRYYYGGSINYRTDARYVGWGASFTLNKFLPIYTVGAQSYTVPYSDVFVSNEPSDSGVWVPSIESVNQRYWDRRIRAFAQVSHSFRTYQSVFGRWGATSRSPQNELPANVYVPFLPTRGLISSIGGGWRYAKSRAYTKSISPEDARVVSLVGEVTSPLLGSYVLDEGGERVSFSQLQLTAEWREYTSVPWADNHVLATKLATGSSFGDSFQFGSYRLGGSFGESAYNTLPDEWRALRGYTPATVDGDFFYLGSAEYRLPLLWVDRGVDTIPFFARSLSAAVFVDAGNAFYETNDGQSTNTLVGTGAEVRASMIVGWGLPLTVRMGYGFGLTGANPIPLGNVEGFYTWLGSSF